MTPLLEDRRRKICGSRPGCQLGQNAPAAFRRHPITLSSCGSAGRPLGDLGRGCPRTAGRAVHLPAVGKPGCSFRTNHVALSGLSPPLTFKTRPTAQTPTHQFSALSFNCSLPGTGHAGPIIVHPASRQLTSPERSVHKAGLAVFRSTPTKFTHRLDHGIQRSAQMLGLQSRIHADADAGRIDLHLEVQADYPNATADRDRLATSCRTWKFPAPQGAGRTHATPASLTTT